MRVLRQLCALAALQIGVENEPALPVSIGAMPFQQDHAHRRMTARIGRRQRHGIAVIGFAVACLFEPGIENGVGILAFHIAPIG
jgi:hypothetical protein